MDHALLAASALSLAGAIGAGLVAHRVDRELRQFPLRSRPLNDSPLSSHPLDMAVHAVLRLVPPHWRSGLGTNPKLVRSLYASLAVTWCLTMLGLALLSEALVAP
jgi:hypothetical protein